MLAVAAVLSRLLVVQPDGGVEILTPDLSVLPGQGVTATPPTYPQPLGTSEAPDADVIVRDSDAAPGVAASDMKTRTRTV